MSGEIDFVETQRVPLCPSCGAALETIEYHRQRLSFGFMSGSTWVILLLCPSCGKVLGTQSWG